MSFSRKLKDMAIDPCQPRRRIGIGLIKVDENIQTELKDVQKTTADLVVIGTETVANSLRNDFQCLASRDPTMTIVEMLRDGEIDAGVRGNLENCNRSSLYSRLKEAFRLDEIARCSLLRIGKPEFFFGPTGLGEYFHGESMMHYAEQVIDYIKMFDIKPKIVFLSGPKPEGECVSPIASKLQELAEESRPVQEKLRQDGYFVEELPTNEFQRAISEYNLVLSTECVLGGTISHVLRGACDRANLLAAPILSNQFVFEDPSRWEGNFGNHVTAAVARVNWLHSQTISY
jgi:predicted methyltransferase MtxX (methanogen marker protein 4)